MKIIRTIFAIILFLAFSAILGRAGYWDCHYFRYGMIIDIQEKTISVKDNRGNVWKCHGTGFEKGNIVKLLMFTNHTDSNIFDDKIEGIFPS